MVVNPIFPLICLAVTECCKGLLRSPIAGKPAPTVTMQAFVGAGLPAIGPQGGPSDPQALANSGRSPDNPNA
ncbi:hypothetical protein CCOS191_0213 [Pseudomonas sp. CCOS 191]|nr:hypothetical protein CCOS191_0213 [Pseudomonas sp. CCOS 191]